MDKMHQGSDVTKAIEATVACALACRECVSACLEEDEIGMYRECIRMNRDCAWICDLTGAYLLSNSPFQAQACQLCADVCRACAAECHIHSHRDHCRRCAEACHACSEICHSLAVALV
jgi:hypothetical protein